MKIVALKERHDGETRVAVIPETVDKLVKAGHEVSLEKDAGHAAGFPDASFVSSGAKIAEDRAEALAQADLVLKVRAPTPEEAAMLREGSALVSFLYPTGHLDTVKVLLERKVSALALDALPRITRAQSMDALSSMSTVAGYRAVILAANLSGNFFPLLMTAAGTVPPARVFVIGAGVAGLQAIATAHRLGAVVDAFDTRPAVKEQVESLGARFVQVHVPQAGEAAGGYAKELGEEEEKKEREALAKFVKGADVVITTALVPGKPAPRLITKEMVEAMAPGSVIVDLAAITGGNCETTEPGKTVTVHDVVCAGPLDLATSMPKSASRMFSRNVLSLVELLAPKDAQMNLDFEDEILAGTCVTHAGEVRHEATRKAMEGSSS